MVWNIQAAWEGHTSSPKALLPLGGPLPGQQQYPVSAISQFPRPSCSQREDSTLPMLLRSSWILVIIELKFDFSIKLWPYEGEKSDIILQCFDRQADINWKAVITWMLRKKTPRATVPSIYTELWMTKSYWEINQIYPLLQVVMSQLGLAGSWLGSGTGADQNGS